MRKNVTRIVVSSCAVDVFSTSIEESPAAKYQDPESRAFLVLSGIILLITGGLLLYSQTVSFVWDEGFHVLAAQLIARGKIPYIDFCFPQTPLNAYWNAGWLAIFGQTWRVLHVLAALATAGAVFLIAEFVLARFPIRRWRFASALVVVAFVGLNAVIVQFGTIAQAYGIGMFLCVAAFRVSIAAVARRGYWLSFAAGLLAGAAAGCTLLTAPVAPVLLIWMMVCNRSGNRWAKFGFFIAGAAIPFIPVFFLFAKAPRQTWFNVVQYQAMYRRVNWNGATPHDVDVLSAWLDSAQGLLMALLAGAGLWFLTKKMNGDRARRQEFYLCAWLTVTLVLYIATAHPTFQRYFAFAAPFASAVAALGLYWVGSRLSSPDRPLGPTLLVIVLLTLSLARALFDDRDSVTWHDYEEIARKVDKVTRPNGRLYADELVYFLTQRQPPSGLEFSYAHKLELSHAQERLYHVISQRELNDQVKAGKFDTVQTCNDDLTDELDLANLFPHKADVRDCSIFWGKVKAPASVKAAK